MLGLMLMLSVLAATHIVDMPIQIITLFTSLHELFFDKSVHYGALTAARSQSSIQNLLPLSHRISNFVTALVFRLFKHVHLL
ncbi:hypothetical protein O9992_07075 [Vibrio lentus]|nr:hypothetical protein [Vibrio lentus]